MIFIKSIFLSFTVWVLTALLSALLCGTWLSFFSDDFGGGPGIYVAVFVFTLLFSVPGIFIFWLVLITNWDNDFLFRLLLRAGLVISSLSSLLIFVLPVVEKDQQIFLYPCLLIASLTSIMMHHSSIKSFFKNKIVENHA